MESELRTVVCVTTPIALLAIWEYKTLAFLLKPSFLPSFPQPEIGLESTKEEEEEEEEEKEGHIRTL